MQREVYRNFLHAFVKIVQEEGPSELYRGLTPSLIGVIPYAATNYFAYDTLKKLYRKTFKKQEISNVATLLIGSAAGAISSTATFPLEVARKHMQVGYAFSYRWNLILILWKSGIFISTCFLKTKLSQNYTMWVISYYNQSRKDLTSLKLKSKPYKTQFFSTSQHGEKNNIIDLTGALYANLDTFNSFTHNLDQYQFQRKEKPSYHSLMYQHIS